MEKNSIEPWSVDIAKPSLRTRALRLMTISFMSTYNTTASTPSTLITSNLPKNCPMIVSIQRRKEMNDYGIFIQLC